MRSIIAIAVVLLGFVGISQAINCYVCAGAGSDCADAFTTDANLEVDCGSTWGAVDDGDCSKLKQYGKAFGVAVTSVTRTCGGGYTNDNCKNPTSVSVVGVNYKQWQCSCTGALCNGSAQISMSFAVLAACLAKFVF